MARRKRIQMQRKPNYCLWDLRTSLKEYLPKKHKLEEPDVNPHCWMASQRQTKEDAAIRWKVCLRRRVTRIAVSATEPPQNQFHGCKVIAAVSATELPENQTSLPNGKGKVRNGSVSCAGKPCCVHSHRNRAIVCNRWSV